jgi:hypothetical protein
MTLHSEPKTTKPTAAPEIGADGSPTAAPGPGAGGKPPAGPNRRWSSRLPWSGLITFGLTQAALLCWWAALYPGLFSPDSLDYIYQATTDHWNTNHSLTYTALVWVSLQLSGSIAPLTLLQTVVMAAALGYAATALRRLGVPGVMLAAAAVAVVALPPVGTFVVCLWKDVPFIATQVFLLGTLTQLVTERRADGQLSHGPKLIFIGAVEMLLACLFRQNGIVVVAIVVALCALLLREVRFRIILAGIAAVAATLLTNLVLVAALPIRSGVSEVAAGTTFSQTDIALAYRQHPEAFTAADTTVMAKAAPLEHWRTAGNCLNGDPLVHSPAYDRAVAMAHQGELIAVWWRVLRRMPGNVIETRICRGSLAWRPTSTGGLSRNPTPWSPGVYLARDTLLPHSKFRNALYPDPLSHRANRLASKLVGETNRPEFEWLLWRGATWSYVAYFAVAVAAWRLRRRAVLVLATVTAGTQISVLLFNAAQAARYMAAPFVLGVLLLTLLTARRPTDPSGRPVPSAGRHD